jgi:hypothetical protein
MRDVVTSVNVFIVFWVVIQCELEVLVPMFVSNIMAEDSMFLQNAGNYLNIHTATQKA